MLPSPVRVGVVTTSYPCTSQPIAGLFVRDLSAALVRAGASVEVVAPAPASGELLAEPGIVPSPVLYAPARFRHAFLRAGAPEAARSPSAWPGLALLPPALCAAVALRERRWDAVVSHWGVPAGLAAALTTRLPHVAFLHSADVFLLERLPFGSTMARAVARSAWATAASSAELAARFDALVGRPVATVRPIGTEERPVGSDERARARASLGIQGSIVLALARHAPVKGLDVAIDAARGAGWTLVLAGDGPERPGLERRARGAPVRFVGTVVGDEKRRWLAAADALVAPSRALPSGRTEGTPTAILEALAAGLPVVASDVGGIAAALGSHGRLVPPGDAGALRAALDATLSGPPTSGPADVPRPDEAARFVLASLGVGAAIAARSAA